MLCSEEKLHSSVMLIVALLSSGDSRTRTMYIVGYFIEEGPDVVVSGARLPSILRFASCLSALVTFSSFFRMSGRYCD